MYPLLFSTGLSLICLSCLADALDNLDDKVAVFFKKCTQPNARTDWREEQFTKLQQVSTI